MIMSSFATRTIKARPDRVVEVLLSNLGSFVGLKGLP